MCDITTFKGRSPGEIEQFQGKMSRRSTRNIGKKVNYNFKEIKDSKEDDIKEETTNMSENEGSDSEDNSHKFNLRKRLKNAVKEESDSDSEGESVERKDRFSRVEDSGDEDYNCDDDDWSDSGRKTKKSEEREKPKTKRILTEYEQMVERNRAEKTEFLKSLKFDEVKESLSEAVQSLEEKHKPVKRVPTPQSPSGPARKSLRKHSELDYSEKALFVRMEAAQNKEIQKRKDKLSRVEDSGDEDYIYEKDSDDDWSDSGHETKKKRILTEYEQMVKKNRAEKTAFLKSLNFDEFKEREKPKMKRNLTEYEKMVERNKAEKMAFLKSLKFDEVKESLSEAVQSLKEKHKPVKRILAPKKPSGPVRKSLRVLRKHSGLDYSEEALVARMEEAQNEEIRKKLPEILPFKDALQETYSYEDFSKEYSNLDHKTTEPFNEHVSHLQTMQLPASQIAKVVGARITSMAFHPMKENILLAASSKYGQIGFWKVNSDQDSFAFVPHTEGITNLRFNPKLPQFIVSSSYDGTLRCGDLEKAVFNEVHNVSEETCCTFFDFLSHSTFLVGQKNGIVSVVDHREKLRAACKKHQCHDVSVKSVSVHPVDNSYFVTAGSRGAIKLWDLRKLQNQPIVEVQHHKRCVQSAYFSPLTGKHVLTTSNDDSICLFDSSNLGKSLLLEHSLKHNNQTGRWLTTFRSTWLPNTDSAFVVGSMLYPRRIEVYDDKMNNICNFFHENLGCITSVNIFHPSLPVLAGANSSGKVYVFTNEDIS